MVWPNLVWPNLVLAKLGLAKLGLGKHGFGHIWSRPSAALTVCRAAKRRGLSHSHSVSGCADASVSLSLSREDVLQRTIADETVSPCGRGPS